MPLIKAFSKNYYLVGGTAIALHLGHRRSIDFDLFTSQEIHRISVRNTIAKCGYTVEQLLYEAFDQMHVIINSIKLTFFSFPHEITPVIDFNEIIRTPSLLDLAAMKTYALGGRAKWKDYVDLYFILRDKVNLDKLSARATEIFGTYFNQKLFREQLCYFDDIDYTEKVDYIGPDVPETIIKDFLTDIATSEFTP